MTGNDEKIKTPENIKPEPSSTLESLKPQQAQNYQEEPDQKSREKVDEDVSYNFEEYSSVVTLADSFSKSLENGDASGFIKSIKSPDDLNKALNIFETAFPRQNGENLEHYISRRNSVKNQLNAAIRDSSGEKS